MPRSSLRLALIVGFVAVACRTAPDPGQLSPSLRREVLLDPTHEFWRTPAPDTVRARFETSKGSFVLEAYRAQGPIGVDRFYNHVRAGFFDDSRFYRVNP